MGPHRRRRTRRAYSEVADTDAEKALEKQLQDAELARLKKEVEGFAPGVRVQSRVEFSAMGPKIEKIVEACQLYVSRTSLVLFFKMR